MIWMWVGFIVFVLAVLALDLGVFHRKPHVVGLKEALSWSAAWIALGLAFSVFVYFAYQGNWLGLGTRHDAVDGGTLDGRNAAAKYLTGYLVEKSLSVDNLFVMSILFAFFGVPAIYQHRVLFWGILGALLIRGIMIGLGTTLIVRFHWVLYVFGVLLICTAVKMLLSKPRESDPARNYMVRLLRRFVPITDRFHAEHFMVRAGSIASHAPPQPGTSVQDDLRVDRARPGKLMLTPLALSLVVIEATDVVFAVDSIPAIFAITADSFLVFTSNIFAVLGLRSLYFALAGLIDKFRYLRVSLSAVLALIGVKMLAARWLRNSLGEHFNLYVLLAVLLILAAGIAASWLAGRREQMIPARREV